MSHPVVHFEIVSKNAGPVQAFYQNLFGWKIDSDNPMNYGMVDTGGQGINGGIGQGEQQLTFYIQADDLQAVLDKANKLGGKTVMPVTEIPGAVTMALFADPDGNTVGLVKSM